MNLCGWHLVEQFCVAHPQSKTLFEEWRDKVLKADPKTAGDFRVMIGHKPDFLSRTVVVFDINSYRIVCTWPGAQFRDINGHQMLLIDDDFPMLHQPYEKWSRRNYS